MASEGATNSDQSPALRKAHGSDAERRRTRRCKITQIIRVRPSDPERESFDDVRGTFSVSRTGLYFLTDVRSYELGMRVFLTLPYSNEPTVIHHEYLAQVVRLEPLITGNIGVGLKLLLEIGLQETPAESDFGEPS